MARRELVRLEAAKGLHRVLAGRRPPVRRGEDDDVGAGRQRLKRPLALHGWQPPVHGRRARASQRLVRRRQGRGRVVQVVAGLLSRKRGQELSINTYLYI